MLKFMCYSGFPLGEVRCEHPPLPHLDQGGGERETPTASRWGVGLRNWISHSIENRYIPSIVYGRFGVSLHSGDSSFP